MKKKPGQYLYVYDTENHQVIIIDGETGERIDKQNDEVVSILQYLDENNETAKLRKFALWCAYRSNDKIKPIQKKLFELAEKAVQGEVETDKLKQMYEETEGTAIATDTVGLQHGAKNAPAFLASRECVNPDAFEGAVQAARFHRLWTEMSAEDDNESTFLKEIRVDTGEDAVIQAEQDQVDYLLDLIGKK